MDRSYRLFSASALSDIGLGSGSHRGFGRCSVFLGSSYPDQKRTVGQFAAHPHFFGGPYQHGGNLPPTEHDASLELP